MRALSTGFIGGPGICVHSETDLDAFDEAFAACFRDHQSRSAALVRKVESWLRNPREMPKLTLE